MKYIKHCLLIIFSVVLMACQNNALQNNQSSSVSTTSTSTSIHQSSDVDELSTLQHTTHFLPSALHHIFAGEINSRQQAVGYHYEGYSPANAKVIESTRSKVDKHNVYRAKITIEGIEKNAYSTFFPKEWTMQQIVDAINEAYENKQLQSGNIYNGKTQSGMTIQMYLTEQGKIISAFPLYNK